MMKRELLRDQTISSINKNTEYEICEIPQELLDMIGKKYSSNCVTFFGTKLKHVRKHQSEFDVQDEFESTILNVDSIIQTPDYIGIHPTNGSVQFVKRKNELVLVAVQFDTNRNKLEFKTLFCITESKLNRYIERGNMIVL